LLSIIMDWLGLSTLIQTQLSSHLQLYINKIHSQEEEITALKSKLQQYQQQYAQTNVVQRIQPTAATTVTDHDDDAMMMDTTPATSRSKPPSTSTSAAAAVTSIRAWIGLYWIAITSTVQYSTVQCSGTTFE